MPHLLVLYNYILIPVDLLLDKIQSAVAAGEKIYFMYFFVIVMKISKCRKKVDKT